MDKVYLIRWIGHSSNEYLSYLSFIPFTMKWSDISQAKQFASYDEAEKYITRSYGSIWPEGYVQIVEIHPLNLTKAQG